MGPHETDQLRRSVDVLQRKVAALESQMAAVHAAVSEAITVIGGENADRFRQHFEERMRQARRG